jgi:hypothetical protein
MSDKKYVTLVMEYEADQDWPDIKLGSEVLGGRTISASIFDEIERSFEKDQLIEEAHQALVTDDDDLQSEVADRLAQHLGWECDQ